MAIADLIGAPERTDRSAAGFRPAATQPGLSAADRAAHDESTFVRRPLAADDHGKTKEPLPSRPRGPHPYRTAAA